MILSCIAQIICIKSDVPVVFFFVYEPSVLYTVSGNSFFYCMKKFEVFL